jgi:hypothetical protein
MIYLYENKYLRLIKKGSVNSMYVEVNEYNETSIKVRKWSSGVPMQQERVIPNKALMQEFKPKIRKKVIPEAKWSWI